MHAASGMVTGEILRLALLAFPATLIGAWLGAGLLAAQRSTLQILAAFAELVPVRCHDDSPRPS
jgi:hypothetical protein